MKTIYRTFIPASLAGFLMLFISSCQKDAIPSVAPISSNTSVEESFYSSFNEFGQKLEEPFSYAVEDRSFAFELVKMTHELKDGDFEVLLPEFLDARLDNQQTAREFLLEKADGIFTAEELDAFMAEYPSTIVAVRGPASTWLTSETYVPPVKFVPKGFDEKTRVTRASQLGAKVDLELTKDFTQAVVAIHMSERHDARGDLIIPVANEQLYRTSPGVSLDQVENTEIPSLCDPEPSACPNPKPSVQSFTATPKNGGIEITWSINNWPYTLCKWGRVRVTRLNPNGTTTSWFRNRLDPPVIFDSSGGQNVSYTYTINAYVAWTGPNPNYPNGSIWKWYTCPADNNMLTASATFPEPGPPVETYAGTNISSTSIRYDWGPTPGAIINNYRIRLEDEVNGTFQNLATLSPGTNAWFYNVPSNKRGTKITTQIEYQAGGPWQGTYYDKTFASFRNSGQPFYYYGMRIADITSYEIGENPIYGAPEIRLTAVRANGVEQTQILAETMIPLTPCLVPFVITFAGNNFTFYDNTDRYYPSAAPNGFPILSQWDADLAGSAITVRTLETDINEVVITEQTNTTSYEESTKAEFGFKLKALTGKLGVESKYKEATETKVRYPVSDVLIDTKTVYYHEFPTNNLGGQLFGNINFSDNCTNLENNL